MQEVQRQNPEITSSPVPQDSHRSSGLTIRIETPRCTTDFLTFLICRFVLQLAQILPTDENFLLLFRRENPLESSVEFMRVSVCLQQLSICFRCKNQTNQRNRAY